MNKNGNEELLTQDEKDALHGVLEHPGMDVLRKILKKRKENLTRQSMTLDDEIKMYRMQGRLQEQEQIWHIVNNEAQRMTEEERIRKKKAQQQS